LRRELNAMTKIALAVVLVATMGCFGSAGPRGDPGVPPSPVAELPWLSVTDGEDGRGPYESGEIVVLQETSVGEAIAWEFALQNEGLAALELDAVRLEGPDDWTLESPEVPQVLEVNGAIVTGTVRGLFDEAGHNEATFIVGSNSEEWPYFELTLSLEVVE
jgi:hypothetical protein